MEAIRCDDCEGSGWVLLENWGGYSPCARCGCKGKILVGETKAGSDLERLCLGAVDFGDLAQRLADHAAVVHDTAAGLGWYSHLSEVLEAESEALTVVAVMGIQRLLHAPPPPRTPSVLSRVGGWLNRLLGLVGPEPSAHPPLCPNERRAS